MSKQNAKFFCENCGHEVPQNARMCRHCGRFFSSVRCPVCGTTGSNKKFENGCPSCGYAVGKGAKQKYNLPKEKTASRKARNNLKNTIDSKYSLRKNKSDGTLPVWSFFVIALILFAFIIGAVKYLGIF